MRGRVLIRYARDAPEGGRKMPRGRREKEAFEGGMVEEGRGKKKRGGGREVLGSGGLLDRMRLVAESAEKEEMGEKRGYGSGRTMKKEGRNVGEKILLG